MHVGFAENDLPPEWNLLSRAAFEGKASQFDQLALVTPGIDPFCSSSFWTLPAHDAFWDGGKAVFGEHPDGMMALSHYETPQWGRMLAPLEASWCLASGFVTARPQAFASALLDLFRSYLVWQSLFLPGLELEGDLWRSLVKRFSEWSLYAGHPAVRCWALLDKGAEGFLERRSAKFRKNLRRAKRLAEANQIDLKWQANWTTEEAESFFTQAMDCESKSWKGLAGEGVHQGSMYRFYSAMVPRLVRSNSFRTVSALRNGEMVGYAFGGVWGHIFRGLQFSFLPELAKVSLGNLMQWTLIENLEREGVAIYDLGMDMPYKHQWADEFMTTHALLVKR